MNEFIMQASNPRSLRVLDEEDQDILDALQTVFPLQAEDAYMIWSSTHIPLGYKYTVSYLLPEVLEILDRLMRDESGSLTSHYPTQEFPAIWHMRWARDDLRIRFEWHAPPSGTQPPLPAHPPLTLSKRAFISEWKQVLGVALRALTNAGYTEEHLSDLAKLQRVYESIAESGVLYQESKGNSPSEGSKSLSA
jgi:hypothetical protein